MEMSQGKNKPRRKEPFLDWLKRFLKELFPNMCVRTWLEVSSVVFNDGTTVKGVIVASTLHNDSQFTVTVAPKSLGGKPAKIDGAPKWSVDREDLVSVTPAADGMSAVVAAVGGVGTAEVMIVADANLGPDETDISVVLDIEVIDAQAAALSVSVGPETPIPAAP
jgi:hypothetical protein